MYTGARICRDQEERQARALEEAETERRRKLTPEQRAAEDKLLEAQGLKVFTKKKEKWNFLQKYHHKGAFYMVNTHTLTQREREHTQLRVGVLCSLLIGTEY